MVGEAAGPNPFSAEKYVRILVFKVTQKNGLTRFWAGKLVIRLWAANTLPRDAA